MRWRCRPERLSGSTWLADQVAHFPRLWRTENPFSASPTGWGPVLRGFLPFRAEIYAWRYRHFALHIGHGEWTGFGEKRAAPAAQQGRR